MSFQHASAADSAWVEVVTGLSTYATTASCWDWMTETSAGSSCTVFVLTVVTRFVADLPPALDDQLSSSHAGRPPQQTGSLIADLLSPVGLSRGSCAHVRVARIPASMPGTCCAMVCRRLRWGGRRRGGGPTVTRVDAHDDTSTPRRRMMGNQRSAVSTTSTPRACRSRWPCPDHDAGFVVAEHADADGLRPFRFIVLIVTALRRDGRAGADGVAPRTGASSARS